MPKRKKSKLPTKVFKYEIGPPIMGALLVDEQIRKSGHYQNDIIGLTNQGREEYREERAKRFPKYPRCEAKIEDLDEQCKKIRKKIKAHKIATRSRKVPPELKAELKPVALELKAAQEELEQLREAIKLNPGFASWTENHNAEYDEKKRTLRGAYGPDGKGVYWGTYNLAEASAQQACKDSHADPRFRAFRGEGRIGVQIQGGMSIADLKTSSQFQIDVPNAIQDNMRCSKCNGEGRIPIRTGKHKGEHSYTTVPCHEHDGLTRGEWRRAERTTMRIRVSSMPDRSPIWAEFPMIMHRPLPDDAKIMGAVVTRRKTGIYRPWTWHLCITCESKKFDCAVPLPDQQGTATINFGWRMMGNQLRVATVRDEKGNVEEILLPASVSDRFRKCDDLRSIIDKQFNIAREELMSWMRRLKSPLPEWFLKSFAGKKKNRKWKMWDEKEDVRKNIAIPSLAQAIQNLSLWKSPSRLARLVGNWSGLRFKEDDVILPSLWGWRKKWMHLEDWNIHNRCNALNIRDDFYNKTAVRLTMAKKTLFIEDFKKKRVVERPQPEEETTGSQIAREHRMWAAISMLQLALKQNGVKYHCAVGFVKAKNNTQRCSFCGTLNDFNAAKELVHTCTECGKTWDQDGNNVVNIEKRVASGQVVPLVMPEDVSVKSGTSDNPIGGVIRTDRDARRDLYNLPKIKADL